jgi:hypothetical protein
MRIAPAHVLVLALAACGGAGGGGPAWPKTSDSAVDPDRPEDDGGESLDPRTATVASVEASDDPTTPATTTDAPAPPSADVPVVDAPGTTPAPTVTEEPVIDAGEIVIEVNGN